MNDIFAEIEIGKQRDSSSASFECSQIPNSQPIKPRIIDPVREKFYEMRSLASKRPFARNESELFFRQAKFMEDFTDDYEAVAKFNMYYPCYQNMGYEYLRTYFSWRTKVRKGEIQPISLSYIFIYIYELLSGIGTSDPSDGLNKLMAIWNKFSKEYAVIEKYLPKWLKDYHIFYELPHSFSDFIEEHKMQKHYSLTLLFDENVENKLELWNNISGYDIRKSKFYMEGNEQMLSDYFAVVLCDIQDFCTKRATQLEDLLVYSISRRSPWQPFKQALFGSNAKQNDREIKISESERYYCKNGQWTANLPIYYSSQKDFVGHVIKKTEACVRKEENYKYKLVADMKSGSKPFRELKRPAAKRAELDKVIEKAVEKHHIERNRTVVKVDHKNLARIRAEALGTQEQLIVPETQESLIPISAGENATVIVGVPSVISSEANKRTPLPEEAVTMTFADGWKALKSALTDIERQALSLALKENADIKTFADENNIMLEVLADSINEKAADCIGDSILELDEEIILYDEYRDNIVATLQDF